MHRLLPYLQIARFDHWLKNVFVLPGTIVAVTADSGLLDAGLLPRLILALIVAGLVASSNYVLNDIIDGPRDRRHPVKRLRPVPSGEVDITAAYLEWGVLGGVGLFLAWLLGPRFFVCALSLWIMGVLYNVPPLRLKDRVFADVLSESINGPIRLLLGWYCTGTDLIPPVSLLIAYWMLGAFFMGTKRFAEYRTIDNPQVAAEYRSSFGFYTEKILLLSLIYYSVAFGLFFGIFLTRYRAELILSLPLVSGLFAWYVHIGFEQDSAAQYPERLYKETGFTLYAVLCALFMIALLFFDFPIIEQVFQPTIEID